ncbi:glycosyltransferase [Alphaproteobacteria bacterium]|nr:glycosyltransferase [Alphaproteobacteria bacterium]
MRIVHFTLGSVNPQSLNGINRVVDGLASAMNKSGLAQASVITVRHKMKSKGRQVFHRDGFDVTACHSTAEALRLFNERRAEIDLVHLHNAWSRQNVQIGRWLAKQNIPYILTSHAAFEPDRMTRKSWLKSLFHRFFQQKLLDEASALIAVSPEEMTSIAQFTSNPRIEFVQNGARDLGGQSLRTQPKSGGPVTLGYLGRISREKNIHGLIQAVHLLPPSIRSKLRIHIYGNEDTAYGRDCEKLLRDLGLSDVVAFCGTVFVEEKKRTLATLDAYIQPSLSDTTPVAVNEALAVGLPVIVTRTCGVSYWHGQPFLTMVEPIASDLARGLAQLVSQRAQLREQGALARAFYEQNLTWDRAAQRQAAVYASCIAKT